MGGWEEAFPISPFPHLPISLSLYPTRKVTPPASVNLIALLSKLSKIWRNRFSSPYTPLGRSGAMSTVKEIPLCSARLPCYIRGGQAYLLYDKSG